MIEEEDPSVREMCRHVLVEWVRAWPDPQRWKHEARWQVDGVAIMSQKLDDEHVWSVTNHFPRAQLEDGSLALVQWRALQVWKELHIAAQQQGDVA
jgi:hypothetical protein